jgi:hypothetical protein
LGACWPLLAAEGASAHPRWLQLGVVVLEAAAGQGPAARSDPRLQECAGQLLSHTRLAARVPQALGWERGWHAEAAATQEFNGAAAAGSDSSAPGTSAAATPEDRLRLTAVLLLQRRLPVLLVRLRHMREVRRQAAACAPWLARLNVLLGFVAAEKALGFLNDASSRAAATAAGAPPAQGADGGRQAASPAAKAAAGSQKKMPAAAVTLLAATVAASSGRKAQEKGVAQTRAGAAAEDAGRPSVTALEEAAAAAGAQAVQCFARAVVLAGRADAGGTKAAAWPTVLNATRALWNCGRQLVNALPQLTQARADGHAGAADSAFAGAGASAHEGPAPAPAWEFQPLPLPRLPPLELSSLLPAGQAGAVAAAPAKGKVAAAGGSSDSKKALARMGSTAASSKSGGGAPVTGEHAAPGARLVLLPVVRRPAACITAAAAAAAEALLGAVARMKARMAADAPEQLRQAVSSNARDDASEGVVVLLPSSLGGAAGRTIEFSLGSDAPSMVWYDGAPVSVPWLGSVVAALVEVMRRGQCWHGVMGIGG